MAMMVVNQEATLHLKNQPKSTFGAFKPSNKPLGYINTQPKFENKRSKLGAWASSFKLWRHLGYPNSKPSLKNKRPKPWVWPSIIKIQAHGYGGDQPRGNPSNQESTQNIQKKSHVSGLGHIQALYQTWKESRIETCTITVILKVGYLTNYHKHQNFKGCNNTPM